METNVIVVDRISNIAVSNGILRIECVSMSASGQEKPSGTVPDPGKCGGSRGSVPRQWHAGAGEEAARGNGGERRRASGNLSHREDVLGLRFARTPA